jgi:hypothetical protein
MKKIFLFAAAAMVSLSSCVQTDEVYTGGVQEIGFKSGVTRAAVDGTELPAGSAITVAGVWDAESDDSYVEYFAPTKFVDDAGIYSGEPARYWPNTGKMQFIGYYPYGVGTFVADYTGDVLAGYKVTGIDGTAQNDILYSDLCQVDAVPAATQALLFHHALALLQVNFQTSLTTEEVKIVSATVADVVLGGDLTVTAGGTSSAAWSNPSAAIDHTFAKVTTAALTTTKNTDATPLLVVPAAAQTEMTIVYTLNGHQMTKVVPLAAYGAWEKGNKYIYNFSIGANEIQFTCEVDPWTDVVVGGGNIAI